MRRLLIASLAVFSLFSLFCLGALTTASAQPGVDGTPFPTATPILTYDVSSDAIIREMQRTNEQIAAQNAELTRQNQSVQSTVNFINAASLLFVILATIGALFGLALFIEYRANIRRARDLLGSVIEETKQMRVLQETVKLRVGDLETLSSRVVTTLGEQQETVRVQLQTAADTYNRNSRELQDTLYARFRDLDSARRDVESASETMRNQIREQLQIVYDRGDKQLKALMDVLNLQARDLNAMKLAVDNTSLDVKNQMREQIQVLADRTETQTRNLLALYAQHRTEIDATRQELGATSQEMRNQTRDQLQHVFERGDEQMRALMAVLNSHLRDFETLRRETVVTSEEIRDRVKNEIEVANTHLAAIQTSADATHSRVDELAQSTQLTLTDQTKNAFERIDKIAQSLAFANQGQAQKAATAIAMAQQGQAQMLRGDLRGALESLTQAVTLDPDNRVLHYQLGDVYARLHDLDKALEQLQTAGAGRGEYAAADVLLAYVVRLQADETEELTEREQKYALATSIYLKALDSDPNLLDQNGESVYGALASLFRNQGRITEAIAYYEHAQKVTPNRSYPVNNLALIHAAQGNRSQAQAYFEQSLNLATAALSINRNDYWAWYDLVTAETALERESETIDQHIDTALNLTPGAEPLRKLLFGLEELEKITTPPDHAGKAAAHVQKELNRRIKQESQD